MVNFNETVASPYLQISQEFCRRFEDQLESLDGDFRGENLEGVEGAPWIHRLSRQCAGKAERNGGCHENSSERIII